MNIPNHFPANRVENSIARIMRRELDIDPGTPLLRSQRLAEDLNIDSLDHIELLMSLENDFDIRITDDEGESVKTIHDLCEAVETALARKNNRAGAA